MPNIGLYMFKFYIRKEGKTSDIIEWKVVSLTLTGGKPRAGQGWYQEQGKGGSTNRRARVVAKHAGQGG